MLSIRLLETEQEISKKINKASAEHLNSQINRNISSVKNKVREFVSRAILSQPEIQSLQGGILQGAFGLVESSSAISAIENTVKNSVSVQFDKFDSNLNGGIKVHIQPSDFNNLLSLTEGRNVTTDGEFHWLMWLLTMGDSSLVVGYSFNPVTGRGRSNLGYMEAGGFFRVPPEFSGDASDNFITRALVGKDQESFIQKIFMDLLK